MTTARSSVPPTNFDEKFVGEFGIAGFFFDFVLAALAHYFSGVPSPIAAIVALVLLMTSYALGKKVYG